MATSSSVMLVTVTCHPHKIVSLKKSLSPFGKVQKNSVGGVQSHLKFSKIWGGSEPHLQNFLNFAKRCVLSCLSNVDNIKEFHPAIKSVFSK